MKKIYIFLIALLLISTSCNDFLEEDFKSGQSTASFYTSVNGLESLIIASYVTSKIWYGKEEGYDFTDVGTDMYTYAQQHPFPEEFTYSPSFNSNNGRLTVLYVELYKGVNACNEALSYLSDPEHPMNDQLQTKRMAEVRFLRAFYFWHLTETWGDIAMPLDYTKGPVVEATKTPVNEVYQQILDDLQFAAENLSDTDNASDSEFGRVTKDAVRAFRARINLNIGSYIESGNVYQFPGSADSYYQAALDDATTLINSGKYSFYDDYDDLWAFSNNTSNRNKEGIWAINYSRNQNAKLNVNSELYESYFAEGQKPYDEREGGHHGHMMWGMRYELYKGMERDIFYGRRFRRYIPNEYLLDTYNEDMDQRFKGQFRTFWLGNSDDETSYPKWEDFNLPGGFTPPSGDYVFQKGDTSIVATLKDIDDSRIAKQKDNNRFLYVDGPYYILDYDLVYNDDGTINTEGTDNRRLFYELKKFDDPERPAANGDGSERGARDAYVFRLAEMYLIAAEAAWKTGGNGYQYLVELADTRAAEGVTGEELLTSYGVNSNGDLDMNFFLDERAREFPGEQLRWFDLKRSFIPSEWVGRIKKYNFDTREHLDQHHYVRPIPQVQLDALENASEFGQNEGY